jgi:hypothetical protein
MLNLLLHLCLDALAGEDIMFNYRGCFCFNTTECWSQNSTMYSLTNNVSKRAGLNDLHICLPAWGLLTR